MADNEIISIIEELFVDDAVDMLDELPANVVKRLLNNVNPEKRNKINQFLQYPEYSAGSIMTAEFIDLKKGMTVREALRKIRLSAIDSDTIYTCYITDAQRRLEGTIETRQLLLANDDDLIDNIYDENVIYATTTVDQEEVGKMFSKYGFLSIPVVDHEKRLVGIITVDDAVDIIQEEATEDFQKMAAMAPSEREYLKSNIFQLSKDRILWLFILMISAMFTGFILERFEHAIIALPLLVTFVPMLTDTGGNAGAQSSTLVIRGLALSEIKVTDAYKVFFKELGVSLLVGIALASVNMIRIVIQYPGQVMVGLTVSLSILFTVIIAKSVGGLLPILAKVLKLDPAIMAAPIITTIVDASALVVYFLLARAILNI